MQHFYNSFLFPLRSSNMTACRLLFQWPYIFYLKLYIFLIINFMQKGFSCIYVVPYFTKQFPPSNISTAINLTSKHQKIAMLLKFSTFFTTKNIIDAETICGNTVTGKLVKSTLEYLEDHKSDPSQKKKSLNVLKNEV